MTVKMGILSVLATLSAILGANSSFQVAVNAQEMSFQPIQEGCSEFGDVRLIEKITDEEGILQLCAFIPRDGKKWRYISPIDWSDRATNLACEQLELGSEWLKWDTVDLSEDVETREMTDTCCYGQSSIYSCRVHNYFPSRDKVVRIGCYQTCPSAPFQPEEFMKIATTATSNSTVISNDPGLTVFTVLLAVSLFITITGWIASCVYLKKTANRQSSTKTVVSSNNQQGSSSLQRHLENPMYDGSTSTPAAETSAAGATYSEVSPHSYDVIAARSQDTGNGSLDYNVLERHANNQNSESGVYHVLEHGPGSHDSHEAGEYEVPTTGHQQYSTLNY